jgi:hypothetical protein
MDQPKKLVQICRLMQSTSDECHGFSMSIDLNQPRLAFCFPALQWKFRVSVVVVLVEPIGFECSFGLEILLVPRARICGTWIGLALPGCSFFGDLAWPMRQRRGRRRLRRRREKGARLGPFPSVPMGRDRSVSCTSLSTRHVLA